MSSLSPWDPSTEYRIEPSGTPPSVDGYGVPEPKFLVCHQCGASVQLTRDPEDPGVDELPHESTCPQRFVRSEWWRSQVDQ